MRAPQSVKRLPRKRRLLNVRTTAERPYRRGDEGEPRVPPPLSVPPGAGQQGPRCGARCTPDARQPVARHEKGKAATERPPDPNVEPDGPRLSHCQPRRILAGPP